MMPSSWDSGSERSSSSQSSIDQDEINRRLTPYWPKYRGALQCRGFRLDTCRDVKDYYYRYAEVQPSSPTEWNSNLSGHSRACASLDDNALCKDAGLPDRLFRGSRICDGTRVVVKAVHLHSRELDIIRFLSSLRGDPMNHCIPVLDLIPVAEDTICLIVMEEWSPHLMTDAPCTLRMFLRALYQCIEHTVFMHRHHIAHLDISLRNLLTDCKAHYAYIDYEMSIRFDGVSHPRIHGYRGTEVPPECERGESSDPYKVDVWALAVLILRACKLTGYHVPELMHIIKPMLHDCPNQRPSASVVLQTFDAMVFSLSHERLETYATIR